MTIEILKISIVTAVRNSEHTLSDCIESVKFQSYPNENKEHIIVDGASSDGSITVIEEYRDDLSAVISEPDRGMYDGMNKGISLCTGDIIGILNADDFYPATDILEKVSRVFTAATVDACYGDLNYVYGSNTNRILRRWRSGDYDARRFYQGWMPPHPAFFVRRVFYEHFGGFRQDMGSAADYELMLRFLLKHRLKAVYIPRVMVHMRTGGASNKSLKMRLAANRMDRKAWKVNGLKPYPWTLLLKPIRKLPQFMAFFAQGPFG